jgi:hypothetical protein
MGSLHSRLKTRFESFSASGTAPFEPLQFNSCILTLLDNSGRVTALSITPSSNEPDAPKSATVTFEKERYADHGHYTFLIYESTNTNNEPYASSAAKTALLLDNTELGGSSVRVEAAQSIDDIAGPNVTSASEARDENGQEIEQEDKPRSRIIAEYLAHGYVISDQAIQKAIALDNKHGFSTRFTNALSDFDRKYHATDRAKGLDENYGITNKATSGWRGIHSYFEKALGTPTGRKVCDFYVQTDKQVRDIHAEARRLADLKNSRVASAEYGGQAGERPPAYNDSPAGQAAQGSAQY